MDTRFKNTDFFIEDIDESVKDLTVNDSSVSHLPANTDFFIENIDNNVIEICTDRGITPTAVSVVPANTDFFIVNIDSNVKKIASDLSITPSSVQKVPANTDFFIENIYFNLVLICEELNIEPYEISATPTNTDLFIEAIAKNVEKIMEAQTEIHVSGTFIHAVLSADSKISEYELEGNATQNGTPTPDSPVAVQVVTGEQTVRVVGKNLFDISKVKNGYSNTLVNNGDGTLTINAPAGSSTCQGITPNTLADYCPSLKVGDVVTLSASTTGFRSVYLGSPASTLWAFGTTKTITANMLASAVNFYAQGTTNSTATVSNIQFELGSTATAYDPYQGQEFPIDLGSIELAKIGNYQDRIYKTDGKWYIEKQVGKVVLDGEGRWAQVSSGTFYTDDISDYSRSNNKPLSNNFTSTTNVSGAGSVVDGTIAFGASNLGTQNRFYVKNTTIGWTSETVFKQWLSTHPTTVYYALATPTDTEITDETLLAQLNAIYALELKEGIVNISITATSPNLPASLKATIIAKE